MAIRSVSRAADYHWAVYGCLLGGVAACVPDPETRTVYALGAPSSSCVPDAGEDVDASDADCACFEPDGSVNGLGDSGPDAPPPVRPSIVLYLADDLDWRGYLGTSRLRAELAADGMEFERFIAPVALCCSFRVTMLRGQYAHNSGIWHNGGATGGFGAFYNSGKEADTVAVWLEAAGYETWLGGKYLNDYPKVSFGGLNYIPPGWTHWAVVNGGNGYSQYNYSLNIDGTTVPYGSAAADYGTDALTDLAVARINATPPGQPFLMIIAPHSPHSPATPPPRYQNATATGVPHTGSFNEADVSDKPSWIQALPLLTSQQQLAMDNLEKKRQRSLMAIEDSVDEVRAAMDARSEPYFFFFASDNGFHQGEHRQQGGKGTAYEEDIRLPLVVVGPGIAPGSTSDELVGPTDFAPTWAEIAGATVPSFVDGRSILPILHGQTPTWRQVMLLEHEDNDPPGAPLDGDDAPTFVGLRLSNATFVSYPITNEFEYYGLPSDPFQLVNTYSSLPPGEAATMLAKANALRAASGAALRALEEAP